MVGFNPRWIEQAVGAGVGGGFLRQENRESSRAGVCSQGAGGQGDLAVRTPQW